MTEYLKFQEEKLDDIHIALITGEIDVNSTQQLSDYLMHIIGIGQYKIILDFQNVTFIDSAGMSVIVNKRNFAIEKHGDIVLINITSNVLELINLLASPNKSIIKVDKEEAQKYFNE